MKYRIALLAVSQIVVGALCLSAQDASGVVAAFYPQSLVNWSQAHPSSEPQREQAFVAADLDRSGSQYLVAAYSNGWVGAVRLIKNAARGPVLVAETDAVLYDRSPHVKAIDIDGDGTPEFLVTFSSGGRSGTRYGWFFASDGRSLRPMNGTAKGAMTPFTDPNLADIDGDGVLEVLTPSDASDPDTSWDVDRLNAGVFVPANRTLCYFGVATRQKGEPFVQSDTFAAAAGNYIVRVSNGDRGQNLVDSAILKVNGKTVLRPDDFREKPKTLAAPVVLQSSNSIEMELRSAPGSRIYVFVEPVP